MALNYPYWLLSDVIEDGCQRFKAARDGRRSRRRRPPRPAGGGSPPSANAFKRSEEHTSELQSLTNLVCRLLLEKKKQKNRPDRMNLSLQRQRTARQGAVAG